MTGEDIRKYLLYALGEIVLVVIGILIALQIGEWAERRGDDERFRTILEDVGTELTADIEQADQLLPYGESQDALVDSMMEGSFDRADYEARFDLFWVGMQYVQYTPTRVAYDRLTEFDGWISPDYGPVLDVLGQHYVQEWASLDDRTEIFIDQIERRHEHLSRTQPWYWRLRAREPNEEMLRWHLESDERRGYLLQYRADQTMAPGGYVDRYRGSAIGTLLAVGDAIGLDELPRSVEELRVRDQNALGDWVGEWTFRCAPVDRGGTVALELRSGVLVLGAAVLRPVDDTTFMQLGAWERRRIVTSRLSDGTPALVESDAGLGTPCRYTRRADAARD